MAATHSTASCASGGDSPRLHRVACAAQRPLHCEPGALVPPHAPSLVQPLGRPLQPLRQPLCALCLGLCRARHTRTAEALFTLQLRGFAGDRACAQVENSRAQACSALLARCTQVATLSLAQARTLRIFHLVCLILLLVRILQRQRLRRTRRWQQQQQQQRSLPSAL